jgi:hypothetical protein
VIAFVAVIVSTLMYPAYTYSQLLLPRSTSICFSHSCVCAGEGIKRYWFDHQAPRQHAEDGTVQHRLSMSRCSIHKHAIFAVMFTMVFCLS